MVKQGTKTIRNITDTNSPNDRPKQRKKPTDPAADLCRLGTKTNKNSLKNTKKTASMQNIAAAEVPPIEGESVSKRLQFDFSKEIAQDQQEEADDRSVQTDIDRYQDTVQHEQTNTDDAGEEKSAEQVDLPLTQAEQFVPCDFGSDDDEIEVLEDVMEEGDDVEGEEDDTFDAEKSPSTTTKTRPLPRRGFSSRYDFKIKLPPSDKDEMILILNDSLLQLWEKIKELDKSLVIYPWAEGSKAPAIRQSDSVSKTSLSDIRIYFHRAAPREKGGVNYFSAYLGHDIPFQKLQEDLEHWMYRTDVQAGWWYRPLQCEETLKLGWLFGSVREMDIQVLAAEIKRKSGVTVGLRYKTIAVARGVSLGKNDMIQAIHIEIDVKDEGRRAEVQNLYSVNRHAGFPLETKMRLIPERNTLSSPISLAKWDRARNHHNGFLHDVRTFDDPEISVLDFKDPELGNKTLRQVIMATRSEEDPSKRLFVSVDRRFKGTGVRFTVRSDRMIEADARINGGILSFLRGTLDASMHQALDKCFTPRAVSRAGAATWDPINKCVVSEADRMMADFDDILTEDYSIKSEDLEKEGEKEDFTLDLGSLTERVMKTKRAGQEYSAGDSLSTFRNVAERTRRESGATSVSEASETSKTRRTRSEASSVSSVSTATAAATVARIEKEMVEMKSKADDGMEKMQHQMDALTLGINQLTQAFFKQNNTSQEPADSQGAAAGHDK